jgi:hypothetical protein
MSISLPLPPSARDFQIYQRLLLDAVSTRQVAADFSLSQTRVRQIAQRVALWLAQSLTPSSEATDAAYLRLAQHIAADRLQMLYGQAMQGWRATNQSKYAGVILRVTAAMGKMPVTSGALDALIADALEGSLPDNFTVSREQTCSRSGIDVEEPTDTAKTRSSQHTPNSALRTPHSAQSAICNPQSAIASPPPLGACSPNETSEPSLVQATALPPTLTQSPVMPSSDLPPAQSAARQAFLTPAHHRDGMGILPASSFGAGLSTQPKPSQTFGAGLSTPPKPATAGLLPAAEPSAAITELQITPQTLNFTTKKPLSRRDRRRLRRLAAK